MADELIDEITTEEKSVSRLSTKERDSLRISRWKARTDLFYLCTKILGKTWLTKEVHGPLINHLQKFPKPRSIEELQKLDYVDGGIWRYTPVYSNLLDLKGSRQRLILDFRGVGKTTINCEAHSIQWHLNYPNIGIAIFQSSIEKAESIIGGIKQHFQFNSKFRTLFPEYCPRDAKVEDFGTKQKFSHFARNKNSSRREESFESYSISKQAGGIHFEILKFSDIVEEENAKNVDSCQEVINSFHMKQNLLFSPIYWIDLEGTRYHFEDLYGTVVKDWLSAKKSGLMSDWSVYSRGIFRKAGDQQFTPDELEQPDLLDENGLPISWWPEQFPTTHLLKREKTNPSIFASQQRNHPIGGFDGVQIFPHPPEDNSIPGDTYRSQVNVARTEISIDTAFTVNKRSNYTAIVIATIDRYGRVYVINIIHGKFPPDELATKIVALAKTYKPDVIKMEEIGFNRGLEPAIRRILDISGLWINFEFIKRDNQVTKEERIINTLQPWYCGSEKKLRFVKDYINPSAWEALTNELKEFPKSGTDDILDALADLFQGRTWFGREYEKPVSIKPGSEEAFARMLGLEEVLDFDKSGTLTPDLIHRQYMDSSGIL